MTKTEDNKQGQNCVLTSYHSVYVAIPSAVCFDYLEIQEKVVEFIYRWFSAALQKQSEI